jgi:methylglutaconyl-CoA hydratase
MNELVRRTVHDGVATITLDSPGNRNALSARLRGELREHLEASLADEAARVIVLDHTGPVFCAGMDLKESSAAGADGQDMEARGTRDFPAILERLWTSPKPVVAKLAGPARAGGVGIVAACDIAVAAEDATFAFSEVRIGLVPAVISVTVLPRLDVRQAHELFLTGETFDARRAARIGLINSAVPADHLEQEVARYTDLLARGGPGALAATKTLLAGRESTAVHEAFARMARLSARHFAADEGQEGMRAFVEKRPPRWVPDARI